jgi:hypothetical protein
MTARLLTNPDKGHENFKLGYRVPILCKPIERLETEPLNAFSAWTSASS